MSASTKRRQFTVSGPGPVLVPSESRPTKPRARTLRAHHDAALTSDTGRLPPKMRERLALEPKRPRRKPPTPPKRGPVTASTRAGKRVPKRAKRAASRAGRPGRARD